MGLNEHQAGPLAVVVEYAHVLVDAAVLVRLSKLGWMLASFALALRWVVRN